MLFKPDKLNPDKPATKAAQAWYDYMLRGGQPRVMAPWDEMTWFATPQTTLITLTNADEWVNIAPFNPNRVGILISNTAKKQADIRGNIDATVPGDEQVFIDYTEYPCVWVSFGANPVSLGAGVGHIIPPGSLPMVVLQSNLGSLPQYDIFALTDLAGNIVAITELILRDFPEQ